MAKHHRCGALTASGGPCWMRTPEGRRCSFHANHDARRSYAAGPVKRCAYVDPNAGSCFQTVGDAETMCRTHGGSRPKLALGKLRAEAKLLRESAERLERALDALREA